MNIPANLLKIVDGREPEEDLLRLDYTNYKGQRAWRTVRPLRRYWSLGHAYHPGAQWLLVGWDYAKQVERTFAIKDIHNWEDLKDRLGLFYVDRSKTPEQLYAQAVQGFNQPQPAENAGDAMAQAIAQLNAEQHQAPPLRLSLAEVNQLISDVNCQLAAQHDQVVGGDQGRHIAFPRELAERVQAALIDKLQGEAVKDSPILHDNESDPFVLWAEIMRLRHQMQGPEGYPTWQEAAVAERYARIRVEKQLGQAHAVLHADPARWEYRYNEYGTFPDHPPLAGAWEVIENEPMRNHLEEIRSFIQGGYPYELRRLLAVPEVIEGIPPLPIGTPVELTLTYNNSVTSDTPGQVVPQGWIGVVRAVDTARNERNVYFTYERDLGSGEVRPLRGTQFCNQRVSVHHLKPYVHAVKDADA